MSENQKESNKFLKRAGPRALGRFNLENFKVAENKRFDYSSHSVKDLKKLGITSILALEVFQRHSEETGEGAFEIEPTDRAASNLFSYCLLKEIKLKPPKIRVLCFEEKEFKSILWQIEKFTFGDPSFQQQIINLLNKPFWIIREYVPSVPLDSLNGINTKECLNANYPGGRKRLIDIAFASALDLLLNYQKRVPWHSSFSGDPNHLRFAIKQGEGLIDEHVRNPDSVRLDFGDLMLRNSMLELIPLAYFDDRQQYILEVESKLEQACLDLRDVMSARVDPTFVSDHHWEGLQGVTRFFQHFTGYNFTTMAEFQLLLVRFGAHRLQVLFDLTKSTLSLHGSEKTYIKDIEKIDIQFYAEILRKADRILVRYDDVVAYAHTVTIGGYSIRFPDNGGLSNTIMEELSPDASLPPQLKDLDLEFNLKDSLDGSKSLFGDISLKNEDELIKDHFDQIDAKIEEVFGLRMAPFEIPMMGSPRYNPNNPANDTIGDLIDDMKSPSQSILKSGRKTGRSNSRNKSKVSFAGSSEKSKESKRKKGKKGKNPLSRRSSNKESIPEKKKKKPTEKSKSKSKEGSLLNSKSRSSSRKSLKSKPSSKKPARAKKN